MFLFEGIAGHVLCIRWLGTQNLPAVGQVVLHQEELALKRYKLQVQRLDMKEPAIRAWMRRGIQHELQEALASGRGNRKDARRAVPRKGCRSRVGRANQAGSL